MASVSEEAPNSRERQGTEEELLVDTGQDKMDPELTVTECPADTETPQTPSEHAEQKPVEIGIMDKQDTAQEEDADGISNDGLPRADMSFALPGQTAGTDATQTLEVPAEENEATGDTPRGVPVTGTEPALRDVEEIGSLRDEGSGLRKRQLLEGPGVTPALRVPPAAADEDDNGGITLNKCLLVALLLVGVGFGIFDPEGEVSEADPLGKRAVDGSLPSEVEFPAPSQPWIAGIPGRSVDSGISLSGLLDKLTSENQQIRIMHVELQGQKEELEGLLRQEGGRLPADSLESLMRLTRQLSEHLSHEEQTLASLQEELRELRLKMAAAEGAGVGQGRAPAPGAERLSALQAQKETLAAEALMLRQELDKQRGIIASMRQALESLIERVGADLEAPAVLQGLEEMEQRLAFELERSEIWAKVYGTPKEQRKKAKEAKRAQQASVGLDEQSDIVGPTDNLGNQPDVVGPTDKLGDQPDVVGLTNKEGNQPDLLGPTDNLGNQPDGVGLTDNLGDQPDVVGPTDNLDDQPDVLGLTDKEGNQPDLLGPTDNLGDQPDVRGPIGGLGEPAPGITADRPRDVRRERAEGNLDAPQADATRETVGWARRAPAESSSARDAPRGRAAEEAEGGGKAWKKRQAEEGRWGKERGRKAEGPGRLGKGGPKEGGAPRHHEHNKFWKQKPGHLRHRYRAPTGCSDVVACARQEGMELFKVPLEPVRAERFWGLLESYVRASGLGGAWGRELRELAAPFFVDGVFIHQQTRFRDFLDDLEDFVEGIAEKVHGDDDAVEDFEDYIFRGLLGEAATRHKKSKKDSQRSGEKWKRHQEKYRPVNHAGKHRQKNWEKDWGRWRDYEGKAREKDR